MNTRQGQRPLRMGLIGGGGSGFIGQVHVTAATLDRQATLVAGALSSNPDKSRASAAEFGIQTERMDLFLIDKGEKSRPPDERIASHPRHQTTPSGNCLCST